jgi:hypothetical protein
LGETTTGATAAVAIGMGASVFEQETTRVNKQKINTMLRIIIFNQFKIDQKKDITQINLFNGQ